jgi:2,4-dienoyl-CoA reductase-like NADH-dependent reductase (Old Yellow Enzyme family)
MEFKYEGSITPSVCIQFPQDSSHPFIYCIHYLLHKFQFKPPMTTPMHRVAIAPVTRFRAGDNYALLPIMAEYYAQRVLVPGNLLITEATYISAEASGYANAPALTAKLRSIRNE